MISRVFHLKKGERFTVQTYGKEGFKGIYGQHVKEASIVTVTVKKVKR